MRLKTTKLRDAIKMSLTAGAAALALTGTVMAQEQPAPELKSLDAISVTGTRIKSQTMTASVIPPPISRRQKWNFLVSFLEEVP